MISPIKKKKVEKTTNEIKITKKVFDDLIKNIYHTMLEYSRLRSIYLTKNNPILIGNVEFWFEIDPETNESQIKFNRSINVWDENKIRTDLELYCHTLYYNTEPR